MVNVEGVHLEIRSGSHIEWLPKDQASKKCCNAKPEIGPMSTRYDVGKGAEDYFKLVSSIIAKYCPSPYVTPLSCPKCNA